MPARTSRRKHSAAAHAADLVLSRFGRMSLVEAWWKAEHFAEPDHWGILTRGEWAAIESIAARQRRRSEAFVP